MVRHLEEINNNTNNFIYPGKKTGQNEVSIDLTNMIVSIHVHQVGKCSDLKLCKCS